MKKPPLEGRTVFLKCLPPSRDFTEEERNVQPPNNSFPLPFYYFIYIDSIFCTQWHFPVKMNEDILTTLKILIIGESGVGKSRYET